jgi:NTE family protein
MTDESSAVVLSGGGAYGAYEVGVLKALFTGHSPATKYVPLRPSVLAGTSIGGFNAAAVLSTPTVDPEAGVRFLEEVWTERIAERAGDCGSGVFRYRWNVFKALDPRCLILNPVGQLAEFAEDTSFFVNDWPRRTVNFFESSADVQQRAIELFDIGSFVTADSFFDVIRDIVEPAFIRRSDIALRVSTTNWRTGELRVFRNADMTDAIATAALVAATSMPGVVNSVEIEGEPYVDGSVVMNTPLKPAIEAGGDVLHVVYMDPDAQSIPLPRLRNTIDAIYRLLVIGFGSVMNRDIEIATRINRALEEGGRHVLQRPERDYRKLTIHRYHPREELGGAFKWLTFNRDHILSLIASGYADAVEHDCVESRCIVPDYVANG